MRVEALETLICGRAHGEDRHSERDGLHLGELGDRIVGEVGLVGHDHRVRSAVPGRGQVALEPPRVEVAAERRHEKDGVHVRCDDLSDRPRQRLLARECRAPRQHRLDHRLALAVERPRGDPVADGGLLILSETSCGDAAEPAELGQQLARAVVARRDARRNQVVVLVRPERVREEGVPAEVLQVQRSLLRLGNEKAPVRARGEPQESRC